MPEEFRDQKVRMPNGEIRPIRVKVLATGSREARRAEQRKRAALQKQRQMAQQQQAAQRPAGKPATPAD